ncbi:hypothetical protein SVIOM74S_00587 [Streptomyces violarus]
MGAVNVLKKAAHLLPGHARQQPLSRLDDGDFEAKLCGHRSDLQADVATADEDELAARDELRTQRVDVVDPAQREEVVELVHVHAWQCQAPRAASCRQDESVVRQATAVADDEFFHRPVDRFRPCAQPQCDVEAFVRRGRLEVKLLPGEFSEEEALREWRALVRRAQLVSDEGDAAAPAALAQRRCEFTAGLSGPDHN